MKNLPELPIISLLEKAKKYACECHESTNHLYDGKPYSFHLEKVVEVAWKFLDLIPIEHRQNILSACWTHDVIEDCRQTYNDVKTATNESVADIVYALTNEKGKNRNERANDKYYEDIKKVPYASFVKICDRIANYEYAKEQKSKMASLYEEEMPYFIDKLYDETYNSMFDHLSSLVKRKKPIANIKDWNIEKGESMFFLTGRIYDHPNLNISNGVYAYTSTLLSIDFKNQTAETLNTIYKLC